MPKEPTKDRRLELAQESLRGLVEDRYRVKLREGDNSPRLAEFDGQIARVEAEVAKLEGGK